MTGRKTYPLARLAIGAGLSASIPVAGQVSYELAFTLTGVAEHDSFGSSIAGVGDLDGDGIPDLAVGALGRDIGFENAGEVTVYSGRDGVPIFSVTGARIQERLGVAVHGIGDLTGDGVPDLAIAAGSFLPDRAGAIWIISGAEGTLHSVIDGVSPADRFGLSLATIPDLDGDGIDELVIGARQHDEFTGRVGVYSGADGRLIREFAGDAPGSWFGSSLAAVGSPNGDADPLILIGAPGPAYTGLGAVLIIAATDWEERLRIQSTAPGSRFGTAAAFTADLDQDGVADLIVSSPAEYGEGRWSRLRLLSGRTGEEIAHTNGLAFGGLGASLTVLGDVNSDGVPDYLVGESGVSWSTGRALLLSGADLSTIHIFEGSQREDGFGQSVAALGDLNGDGIPDFAIGAGQLFNGNPGYVRVYVSVIDGPCGPADFALPWDVLDLNDIVVFINAVIEADSSADLDGDGDIDLDDISEFTEAFFAGCV